MPFNVRGTSGSGITGRIRSLLKSVTLDDRYDLREHIDVEVKNQMDTGECWAFSANSTVETNLALNNKTYDFSERHVDYDTSNSFIDGENIDALNREVGSGGYFSTAFTYYSRGSGPILEEYMPFENNEVSIELADLPKNVAIQKVDNMIYFPSIYKRVGSEGEIICEDADGVEYTKGEVQAIRNQVKEHIMKNGGVTTHIYAPYDYFYSEYFHSSNVNDDSFFSNHAVTIIGWDDNYSRENFNNWATEDGAYIVLNSWGNEWGDNGVYYISYEDCLVEAAMAGVSNVSDIEYDNLYQHDTSEVWNDIESKYAANIFTSKNDEVLKEIMINSLTEQTCDIYINALGDNLNINNLTKIAENVNLRPGYNTVEIENNIELVAGNKFAIVVKITSDNYSGIGIEDNNDVWFGNAVSSPNESFISDDGINWTDIYDNNNMMNLSIKAYTQTKETYLEVSDIIGIGYEGLGGNYSFNIKTSYRLNDNSVNINIYKEDRDVTNQFKIIRNTIIGNGAYIKLETGDTIQSGEYSVVINLSEIENIVKKFNVNEKDENFIIAQFNDENFYNYAKSIVKNSFKDDSKMQIMAKEIDFNDTLAISAPFSNITDITGIEYFKSAAIIDLRYNNIQNIEKLKELNNIYELYLTENQIENINSLTELKNIEKLYLTNNPITDFSVLNELVNLKDLELQYCTINNLNFLENTTLLERLDLYNAITSPNMDISNIFKLQNLQNLDLSGWEWITEKELANLNKLEQLEILYLMSCNIGSIEFLREMSLIGLHLSNNIADSGVNYFSDLTPIENMITLSELGIGGLPNITDLNVLGNLSNLGVLFADGGRIEDASVLDSQTFANKEFWDNLFLNGNNIQKEIEISSYDSIVINVPKIIEQASNENSILYSEQGFDIWGCEWEEYGKSIRINPREWMNCGICVLSGYAGNTCARYDLKEEIKEITANISKTTYLIGEDLDLSAGGIKIIYESGRGEFIPWDAEGVIIEGYDKTQLGEQIVTVTYGGQTTTFTVTVTNDIIGIDIAKAPDKVTYIKGEDLDFTGGLITLIYQDRTTSEIPMTTEGVNQPGIYDKTKLGEQTITIECLGYRADFKINVTNEVIGIDIAKAPDKVTYIKGEDLDFTGGLITLIYQDRTTSEIPMTTEGVNQPGIYDKTKLGEQTITIEYLGKRADFRVEVIEKVIESEKYEVTVQNDTNYIENITENVSVEEFKNNIAVKGSIEIYKNNKKIEDDKIKLSTGMVLKVTLNNKTTDYNIVVTGDVNGDGDTNQIDLLMLARYKAGFEKEKEMVQNAYLRATDIMKDNNLATDIDLLKFARVLAHLDEL